MKLTQCRIQFLNSLKNSVISILCHVLTFLFLMSSVYFYWPGKAEVQFLVKMKAFEIRFHMKNALSLWEAKKDCWSQWNWWKRASWKCQKGRFVGGHYKFVAPFYLFNWTAKWCAQLEMRQQGTIYNVAAIKVKPPTDKQTLMWNPNT